MNQTKLAENVRVLQEVLFILDEVEDKPCSVYDVNSIVLNPFFEDYIQVIDSCKLIISQQLYSNTSYDLSQWCLLLPMEYIFEDFFAGFLDEKFGDKWKVHYQKSDLNLSDNPKAFRMQHDIFLTAKDGSNRKIIVDTKYKVRDIGFKSDAKKGVSQNDLYQMVSYAYKRGCTDVMLVYPNISDQINPPDSFDITSGFLGKETINVFAFEVPFWSSAGPIGLDERLFETIKSNLDRYLLPSS